MQDPDLNLVDQAQRGDKTALAKLVDQYYKMVYALCYGVLHQREEAQDITQEIFIKVSRVLQTFERQSKFKTWLYRLTINAAIDAARRRKPYIPIDEIPLETPRTHGPREQASSAELSLLVRQALQNLSVEHRAVLILREWQDLSYEEIAQVLGIEIGTVMSRIHYARKKLAESLHLSPEEVME